MIEQEFNSITTSARIADLFRRVYAWMALGLTLSAVTAYYVSTVPAIYTFLFRNSALVFSLFALQLGLVVILSMFINRMSFTTAWLLFVLYAFSLGLTLSGIFIVYTMSSIFSVFFITSGMFGAMSLYGYFTQADLTTMGNYLFMGLIGLILAIFVNVFLANSALQFLISIAGVFIFVLLTAYDTQRIKKIGEQMGFYDNDTLNKAALLGALALYLDFINLFVFILQLTGRRR